MFIREILLSHNFTLFLVYGPNVFLALLFLFTALAWLMGAAFSRRRTLFATALAVLAVRILFAALKSYGQYYVWAHDAFGSLFLPPHASWSYFLGYVGLHHWLSVGLAAASALVVYLFLLGLHRYRDRFFEGGEAELALAICLLVGWPGILLFLAGTCVGIIVVSIVRRVWLAQAYTTLGIPLLIGGVLAFVFTPILIGVLGLAALKA